MGYTWHMSLSRRPELSRRNLPRISLVLALVVSAALGGCSESSPGASSAGPKPDSSNVSVEATAGRVDRIVDGDTIVVDGQKIRVIGIDTPERGECGYDSATLAMAALVDGKEVTLTPGAKDDTDKYDRLLRYVEVNGVDAGLTLIRDGWAIARYDSRDGYGAHIREAEYVAADAASEPKCETEFQP